MSARLTGLFSDFTYVPEPFEKKVSDRIRERQVLKAKNIVPAAFKPPSKDHEGQFSKPIHLLSRDKYDKDVQERLVRLQTHKAKCIATQPFRAASPYHRSGVFTPNPRPASFEMEP
eukprot:GFYU01000950.1.p1 GENE.GFYU01000950.1~~GFYU01000950.1.p1  ORF type:complete len:116 (-),score=28.09 GFYU01000950.1:218-565(-)